MQVYLDESGNLGRRGRFFVICALMPENPKRIKNIIKGWIAELRKTNNIILDELKSSFLKFPEKQKILQKLAKKDDFHCSYVVGDKKHIDPNLLKVNNVCFNYLASHLFKPILKGTNEDVQVIIDNRSVKVSSKNSLKDYIKLEGLTKWGFNKKITFEYKDSRDSKNLQAVDLIANVVYGRYTYNKKHLYNLIDNKFVHRIKFPYAKFNT